MGEKRFQKVRRGYHRSHEKAAVEAVLEEELEDLALGIGMGDPGLPELMAAATAGPEAGAPVAAAAATTPSTAAESPPPPTPVHIVGPSALGSAARKVWSRLRELFT